MTQEAQGSSPTSTEGTNYQEIQAIYLKWHNGKRPLSGFIRDIDRYASTVAKAELEQALLAEPDREDADFASQMLAVCTYLKDRIAALNKETS